MPPHLRPDPFFPELGPRGGGSSAPWAPVRERQRVGGINHPPEREREPGVPRASVWIPHRSSVVVPLDRPFPFARWSRCPSSAVVVVVLGSTSSGNSSGSSNSKSAPASQHQQWQQVSHQQARRDKGSLELQAPASGGGETRGFVVLRGGFLRIVWSEEEREREETGPDARKQPPARYARDTGNTPTQQMSRFLGLIFSLGSSSRR